MLQLDTCQRTSTQRQENQGSLVTPSDHWHGGRRRLRRGERGRTQLHRGWWKPRRRNLGCAVRPCARRMEAVSARHLANYSPRLRKTAYMCRALKCACLWVASTGGIWRRGWREGHANLDKSARDMMLQCPTAGMARDQAAMGRGVFAAINQAAKSRAVLAPH